MHSGAVSSGNDSENNSSAFRVFIRRQNRSPEFARCYRINAIGAHYFTSTGSNLLYQGCYLVTKFNSVDVHNGLLMDG